MVTLTGTVLIKNNNFWGNFIEEMREVHHGIFAFGVLSASVYDGFMNSCV